MRYLVTDPCYVVDKEDWDRFLEITNYGASLAEPYELAGIGRIIDNAHTARGDGSWDLGAGKEVCVDSGLVCIVELNDKFNPSTYNGNAITDDKNQAETWMEYVKNYTLEYEEIDDIYE